MFLNSKDIELGLNFEYNQFWKIKALSSPLCAQQVQPVTLWTLSHIPTPPLMSELAAGERERENYFHLLFKFNKL